jgi:hypothetical protein
MTQLSPLSPRPEPQAICRDHLYTLLLEGAGLNDWRIEALLDRVGETDDISARFAAAPNGLNGGRT